MRIEPGQFRRRRGRPCSWTALAILAVGMGARLAVAADLPPDVRVAGSFLPSLSTQPTSQEFLSGDLLVPARLDRDKYLRNRRAAGLGPDVRLQQSDTSGGMIGKVAIALMFVESDGSIDPDVNSWTKPFEDEVIASLNNSLNWLSEQAAAHGSSVSFTLYAYRHDFGSYMWQGYEPMLHPSTDSNLWVEGVLANLGYTDGDHLARVKAYNDSLCVHDRADAAVTMFACCNPEPAAAEFSDGYGAQSYYGGPYLFFVGRTSQAAPLDMTIAHELLHSFYACDEYAYSSYGGCSRCDVCDIHKQVYPNPHGAGNDNCEACNSSPDECIMRAYSWNLCNSTAAQVGWGESLAVPADPLAPVIAPIEDETIEDGTAYHKAASLTQGTSPVVWTLVSSPVGMTVDANTGRIDWLQPEPAGLSQTITLRASNSAGQDEESWILTIGAESPPSQEVPPVTGCGAGALSLSLVTLSLASILRRRAA